MIVRVGLEIRAVEGVHSIIPRLEHAGVHSKVLCALDSVWAVGCVWGLEASAKRVALGLIPLLSLIHI